MSRPALLAPLLFTGCGPAILYPARIGEPVLTCQGDTGACEAVSIDDVPFGRTLSVEIGLANEGHGSLDAALAATDATFEVEPTRVLIDAGGSRTVELSYTPSGFDPAEAALEIAWSGPGSPRVLGLTATTDADADADGYPHDASPGGTDCNDFNPSVHPGADDPLGDGIDQDCSGADG